MLIFALSKLKNELIMKEEKKTNEKFELTDVIGIIAFICGILTVIFGFPHLDFPDDWCEYIFGTVVLTFAYFIGLSLLVAIIGLLIAFIICLFKKNNKESD